jgi:alpha-L-fucosidase
MIISRRQALGVLAATAPALRRASAQPSAEALEIAPGPFKGTRESLRDYRIPDWYRDAKFGIWAHWGPQSAPNTATGTPANMYIQGSSAVQLPREDLRPPVEVRFQGRDPHLEGREVRRRSPDGAVQEGRRKVLLQHGRASRQLRLVELEVSAEVERRRGGTEEGHRRSVRTRRPQAAGLKFAVSEHLAVSYDWFANLAHLRQDRPLAGVPYDGADSAILRPLPRHRPRITTTPKAESYGCPVAPDSWKQLYFKRIKDLIDHYEPDLLYTDGPNSVRGIRPQRWWRT